MATAYWYHFHSNNEWIKNKNFHFIAGKSLFVRWTQDNCYIYSQFFKLNYKTDFRESKKLKVASLMGFQPTSVCVVVVVRVREQGCPHHQDLRMTRGLPCIQLVVFKARMLNTKVNHLQLAQVEMSEILGLELRTRCKEQDIRIAFRCRCGAFNHIWVSPKCLRSITRESAHISFIEAVWLLLRMNPLKSLVKTSIKGGVSRAVLIAGQDAL